jgi:hypothetical protein
MLAQPARLRLSHRIRGGSSPCHTSILAKETSPSRDYTTDLVYAKLSNERVSTSMCSHGIGPTSRRCVRASEMSGAGVRRSGVPSAPRKSFGTTPRRKISRHSSPTAPASLTAPRPSPRGRRRDGTLRRSCPKPKKKVSVPGPGTAPTQKPTEYGRETLGMFDLGQVPAARAMSSREPFRSRPIASCAWEGGSTRSRSPHTTSVGGFRSGSLFKSTSRCPLRPTWERRVASCASRNPGSLARRYCSLSHPPGTRQGRVKRSAARPKTLWAASCPRRP